MAKSNHFMALTKAGLCAALMVGTASIAFAQSNDDAKAAEYAALLQRIADLELTIAHKEVYIGTQKNEIESLRKQISEVEEITSSIDPMMEKMRVAISGEIDADLPFNQVERFERLNRFQELLAEKDALPGDKWRQALRIYEAEVNYGQAVAAYAGEHPIADKRGARFAACEADIASTVCALTKDQKERLEAGETLEQMQRELQDGYYLRFGRVALAYQTADASEVYRYNAETKAWDALTGGRAIEMRRAVKMARGEAAQDVMSVPVSIAN